MERFRFGESTQFRINGGRCSGPLIQREFRFGWPCRSNWATLGSDTAGGMLMSPKGEGLIVLKSASRPGMVFSTQTASIERPRGYAIPVGFLIVGYLVNTLSYAMVWALIFGGLTAFRRFLRRRRGLCPACAYDLRGTPTSSPCPECGERVAAR